MGEYGGHYNHVAAGEPGYVANDGHEDWSWSHNTSTDNTSGYVEEEGEHYYNGVNYEAEHSYTQVEGATTSRGNGHRRVRSASGDHTGFLHSEPAKEKTKKKKKNRQLERLQEPTDTYSDPGVGDGTSSDYSSSQRTDLVSSWLQDATSHAPPERRPPRRHSSGADMVVRSAPLPNQNDEGHYETYESQDNQLALYDPASGVNDYQPEEKALGKALKLWKNKAAGLAVNIKQKAIEVKNMAAPVMNPLINAMMEESRQQLSNVVLGPDGINGIFDQPGGPNSRGRRGRGGSGRGGRGEIGRGGRRGPMPRPMMEGMPLGPRPVTRPGMMPRPEMRPGIMPRPEMMPGMMQRPEMRPGLMPRPEMRPGIMPRPVMRPGLMPRPEMRSGMLPSPVIRPGMMPRPVIRPGMGPPPPGAMVARGALAIRGRARPVAPPDPTL